MVTSGSDKGRNWEAGHDLSCHISFIWLIEGELKEPKSDSEPAAASQSVLVFSSHPKYLNETSGCLVGRAASTAGCTHVETVNRTGGNGLNVEE